jgi:UPF0716 protein FxsA
MALLLVLIFVVAPLVELAVFVQAVQWIGLLETLLLLILVSTLGVFVVRHQGLGVLRRVREQLRAGVLPAADLLNGLLIVVAGILLVLPGFVSDVVAILLLLPPTRAFVRFLLNKHYAVRIASGVGTGTRTIRRVRNTRDVIDVPSSARPTRPDEPGPPPSPPQLPQ